ncbi:MAG: hypothetical protein PVG24_12340 [Gammaproteobacteria bacterium]|jgi:hypothetical protein
MSRSNAPGQQESLNLAKMLIAEHGDRAAHHARRNAERLKRIEDPEGHDSWIRIAYAVDLLLVGSGAGTLH